MNLYTAPCPACLTPVEWCDGEMLEDCCDGATLHRVRQIVESDSWPPKRDTWRQLKKVLQ